jgi:hypothetical protein
MMRAGLRLGGVLALLLAMAPGCVLRTLAVKSKPAGATVYLDDQAVGVTPLELQFDFYGTRAIRVAKEGYRPHEGEVALHAPWYEWFPLDFVSEVLWPGTIRDRHDYALELVKIEPGAVDAAATAEFAARAEHRLLESRMQGYIRDIAMEIERLEQVVQSAEAPAERDAATVRIDRLHAALVALPAAGSLAAMANWEHSHRAAVRGE